MDPLEREKWRHKLAVRMGVIQEGGPSVTCVSAHYYDAFAFCDLCQQKNTVELLVVRNRAGKNFGVAPTCLLEMVRFQVVDALDLGKWTLKLKTLRQDHEERKAEFEKIQREERQKREKKVIVRKKDAPSN
jgi:hypothetical protein